MGTNESPDKECVQLFQSQLDGQSQAHQ